MQTIARRLLLLAAFLPLLLTGIVQAQEPFAAGNFKTACARAAQTKRIVLIDFYTTWCGPCKRLDEDTWKDPGVRRWLAAKTISRKIDAEKETALAKRYKIDAYPTILLLRPDGTEIDRLIGYRAPKEFLEEARLALMGLDSVARSRRKMLAEGKNDPMARMQYAQSLARQSKNAAALKEYLWCLDEGNKHNAAFAGVRLSFLLSYIQQLGQHYPPARVALVQRRDTALERLRKGNATDEIAYEFASYNRTLGELDNTLVLYDELKARNSPQAAYLFDTVVELLLEKRRYADLLSGAGDINARLDSLIERFKSVPPAANADTGLREFYQQQIRETGGTFFEALLGSDRTAEANALRDKLLGVDGSVNTFQTLIQHANRAGKTAVVDELKTLAAAKLPPADAGKIKDAEP